MPNEPNSIPTGNPNSSLISANVLQKPLEIVLTGQTFNVLSVEFFVVTVTNNFKYYALLKKNIKSSSLHFLTVNFSTVLIFFEFLSLLQLDGMAYQQPFLSYT